LRPVIPGPHQREESFDIVIIGGGPAGAAAALSAKQLRPRLRVGLMNPSRYDAWRVGETLSPGCQDILRGLGCWDSFLSAGFMESPGTRSVWGDFEPYDNDFLFSLRGNGWLVDRGRFDALLCECAAASGAEILAGWNVFNAERMGQGFRLYGRDASTAIRADFIIDASGRHACFASKFGARQAVHDSLIGICGVFDAADKDAATLVEAQADGWWYSTLLPDSRALAVWMSDVDLVREGRLYEPERWLDRLGQTKWTNQRVSGGLLGPLRVRTACSQRLSQFRGDGWVAAGDAATAYDPLSSLGVLKALRSGKAASFVAIDALEGRDSGARYDKLISREYANYCETKQRFYSQERRWSMSPFWRRRVNGDHSPWQKRRT
jgi:flavin-dependent dehydrogenase